ncbi:hypothetical protein TBLA_0D01230 [Henningerozyma blattae CBS 6284]|uniref:Translation initiation factor eIF2B subunit gamma n=1 Tax=Henningerozyma blattae (strain ATCC 34711 / CBS 6284 / DSM 70876 / NBRC 10599 / NRRL Y-10934 / UCD 77-7) TaxID=1071380 RepID=I2H2M9_HENB6|nr:hypothetical protein TBLA_0D01230 [Tetrapisispora blattae CBS 6284]CCH60631.1 hypothetical protein TBLA_0D01230 [Tetrapisispora blattae CBS 6284]
MRIQAFIFCGRGRNLSPFTTNTNSSIESNDIESTNKLGNDGTVTYPKALLPVGNRAMIEYVLDWCDQADFKEINIVATADEIDIIQSYLKKKFLKLREQEFDVISKVVSQSNHTHHLRTPAPINFIISKASTTGESLSNEIIDKINGDFVILPCDFITDIPPQVLIDQYRNRDENNLALSIYYTKSKEHIDKKQKTNKEFFTIYSENENSDKQPVLLDCYSKEGVTRDKYLQIRTHLLWNYPNCIVSTKLLNSFIYFCSFELCKLMRKNQQLAVKKSNNKHKPNELSSIDDDDDDNDNKEETDYTMIKTRYFNTSNQLINDPINFNKSLSKIFRDLARRSWKHSKPRETISMFIIPENITTFIRSNNLNSYMEANRYILKLKSRNKTFSSNTNSSGAVIGIDSLVDDSCKIMEKSNIKMSAINTKSSIGNRCRITGSIIFNNTTIEDEVILENVIIGPNAKIGKKTKLTNCYVEGQFIVNDKTAIKGETLKKLYFENGENDNDQEGGEKDSDYDDDDDDDDDDESDSEEEFYEDDDFEDDGLFER